MNEIKLMYFVRGHNNKYLKNIRESKIKKNDIVTALTIIKNIYITVSINPKVPLLNGWIVSWLVFRLFGW